MDSTQLVSISFNIVIVICTFLGIGAALILFTTRLTAYLMFLLDYSHVYDNVHAVIAFQTGLIWFFAAILIASRRDEEFRKTIGQGLELWDWSVAFKDIGLVQGLVTLMLGVVLTGVVAVGRAVLYVSRRF